MAFTIGSVKIRIGADTDALTRDLQKASRELQRSSAQMKSIGTGLTQSLTLPIGLIGVASLKVAGDIEALQKGLTAVMGSSAAAAAEFERLREVAKLPGLGLEQAVEGSVRLQSAGFSANEARRSLLAFGNALATVGKGAAELSLVNLALSQLQNKTSGYGQDLRQLTEQLPQLRDALTAAFGTADSEQIAKLGFTGKQVVQLVTAEFEKLPKVTGGLKNSFENVSDTIKVAMFRVGTAINQAFDVEGLLDSFSAKIESIGVAFDSLSPFTKKIILSIAGIAATIGPVIFAIGSMQAAFAAAVKVVASFGGAGFLASNKIVLALGGVGIAIGAVVVALGIVIYFWDDIIAAVKAAYSQSEFFRNSVINVSEAFSGIISAVKLIGNLFIDLVKSAGYFIQLITGQISFDQALAASKATFYESGKQFGTEIANGIIDSALKKKLGNLSELTGIKGTTGNRADSFKQLGKVTTDAVAPILPAAPDKKKADLTPLQELQKEFAKIDILLKSGFITSLEATDQKLSAVNSAAEKLASKGFKATSNEMQKVIALQKELTATPEVTFSIKTEFKTPEFSVFDELRKKTALIDDDLNSGLISSFTAAQEKIDILKSSISSLNSLGFTNASEEVTGLRQQIEDLGKVSVVGDPFQGLVNLATLAADKIREKWAQVGSTLGNVGQLIGPVSQIFSNFTQSQINEIDKKNQAEKNAINKSLLSEDAKSKRLAEIDKKTAAEKAKIQRKQAIGQKIAGIFSATVSMFQGIAAALSLGPAGVPLIPFIKGIGIANIAAIASTPLPSLSVGTNYVKSDGLAQIHRGEQIVPAKVVAGGYSGAGGGGSNHSITEIKGNDLRILGQMQVYLDKRIR